MTLYEVDEAANRIREDVEVDANIIFGSTFDERLNGKIRVSVVATGIGGLHHQTSPINNISMPKDDMVTSYQTPKSVNPFLNLTKHEQKASTSHQEEDVFESQTKNFNDDFDSKYQDDSLDASKSHNEPHDENIFTKAHGQNDHAFEDQQIEKKEFDVNKVAPKKKQPSLFERIAGVGRAKNSQSYPPSSASFTQMDDKDFSHNDSNFDSAKNNKGSEILDIPAFLRRGNNS